MWPVMDLAKFILNMCVSDGVPISNLQLQKILFFIQEDFLTNLDTSAFDERIEAWQFGPVVPDAYHRYSGNGSRPIKILQNDGFLTDEDAMNRVREIVRKRRRQNPWALVDETHRPGGAWATIFDNGLGNHKIIPQSLIKELR